MFVAVTWLLAPTSDELARQWALVDGRSFGQPIEQVGTTPLRFTADDGRIGGHDGCNRFSAAGSITAGWMGTNPLRGYESTLVGCPDALDEAADRYRSAVTLWARWARVTTSGELVLWGPGTTLRFEPLEPGVNADQWWTLVQGTVAGESFTAHDDPNLPTIWLHIPLDDTQPIEGNNGCNSWWADHDAIEIGGTVSIAERLERTDTDCEGHMGEANAAAIQPIEELVFASLTAADRAERDGDQLVFSGPDVELVYVLGR